MNKFAIKIKTSIVILFTIIILFVVGTIMFFQYKASNEFALLTTQKVFNRISDKVIHEIERYDDEGKKFIDLVKQINNSGKYPELNKKHAITPVIIEHIKSLNYIYAVYVGYKNDYFYEIINLNLSNTIKKDLNAPSNARWLIIKHFEKNGVIVRYEELLDKSLKQISLIEKTTQYKTSSRPWFKKAINSDSATKTEPYFFSTLKQYGLTYAKNINKEHGAVLGLDISLKSLSKLLKKQKLVEGSASFIFSDNGHIIGQYDNISNKHIQNLNSEYPNKFILDGKVLDLNEQKIITINNIEYLKYTTLLKSKFGSKDYLTILSPIDIIMKPYKDKIYEALIITALILIIFIFPIIFYAIRLIVNPILDLEKENQKIAKGNFKKVIAVPSFMIEISNLSDSLVNMANSIDDLTDNLEDKIEERTKEVEEKNKNIANLLNNAGQGFLYFDSNMIVGNEVSKETSRIFNKDIIGSNILEILYPNDIEQQESTKSSMLFILDSDEDTREVMISLLKTDFTINKQFIEFEYKVLNQDTFMLILTDITAKKELDQQIKDEQQVLKMIVETVTSIEQFTDVKNAYESMILNIQEYKSLDKLSALRMEIHTYKGLFAQKNMLNIVKKLHDFESLIDESLKSKKISPIIIETNKDTMQSWLETDISTLKKVLGDDYFNSEGKISISSHRIDYIIENITILRDEIKTYFKKHSDKPELSVKFKNIISNMKNLKNTNIEIFINPYINLVEQLANRLEKPVNPLVINKKDDIYLNDSYKPFLNSLVHIFRNSVDHGIETLEKREELGKELYGTIVFDIYKEKKKLFINIGDDGKGIDINIIKKLALEREIYTKQELKNLTEQEILLIVFKDAFSTNNNITDISGRGVGLASILYELNNLDGNILIENKLGEGITFMFTLPLNT